MATSLNQTGYSDQDLFKMQQDAIRRMKEMQQRSREYHGTPRPEQQAPEFNTHQGSSANNTGNNAQGNRSSSNPLGNLFGGGNPLAGLFGGGNNGGGNTGGGLLNGLFGGGNSGSGSGGLLSSLFGGGSKGEDGQERKGGLTGLLAGLNLDSDIIIIGLMILLLSREGEGENHKLILALIYLLL